MRANLARDLASYNQWMNQRLYAACAGLTDAERRQDRGVFFKSIHGTLNHLLLGDRVWLSRFRRTQFRPRGLDEELYAEFDELRRERERTDEDIIGWVASLTDEALAGQLRYTSIVNPAPRRCEMSVAVAQLFNHQTHHRGQVTAMLSQCGMDYGVTDLIWLPQVRTRNEI